MMREGNDFLDVSVVADFNFFKTGAIGAECTDDQFSRPGINTECGYRHGRVSAWSGNCQDRIDVVLAALTVCMSCEPEIQTGLRISAAKIGIGQLLKVEGHPHAAIKGGIGRTVRKYDPAGG